jgi:hypothetical protein
MSTVLQSKLVGKWQIDPSDQAALDRFGNVLLEFRNDGSLVYVVESDSKDQIIFLRFRIGGEDLITDQPSAPKEERTRFGFTEDGRLFLEHEQGRAHYMRRIV